MATRRRARPHQSMNDLLNDDNNSGTRRDKSLVHNPKPHFDQHEAGEHGSSSRYKPAEPRWEQGLPPMLKREPPGQERRQRQPENLPNDLERLTAQTILNPAISKDVTVHFDMDVTDDVGCLLEEFSRLKRLGDFQAAAQYFDENLGGFTDVVPVVIEYADMLVEQGAYQRLEDFLRPHHQLLQRIRKVGLDFTDEERYTFLYRLNLRLLNAYASMHLTGDTAKPSHAVHAVADALSLVSRDRAPPLASLDSAEVQIFAYALKILSWIERETDSNPESEFDYWANCNHLYEPLIAMGQVWDARDLICALIESEGASNTWDIMFQTDIESPGAFTKLLADWNTEQYDEATYLAILDILVHASNALSSCTFSAPTPEDLSLAARCLNHARDIATCLKENNPDLVHCRSYLAWILAETQLRRKRRPTGSDLGRHLSGYPGLTVWTNTLPIYLPIRSENPTWCPPSGTPEQIRTSDDELLEAAVETAMGREDYTTEVACLAELIYRGTGGPQIREQRLSRMYDLQFRCQRDVLNAQHTCLSRFLTRSNDQDRRALLADINELQRHIPNEVPYTPILTSWCMQVVEKSIKYQTSGPTLQPPSSNNAWSSGRDLPQYIKDQLTARGLARSYGLDLDDTDTFGHRRTTYYSRSPERANRFGPIHPPPPSTGRRESYERERPTRDPRIYDPLNSRKVVPSKSIITPTRNIRDPIGISGSESERDDEEPGDTLVRRVRGPVVYHRPADSDGAEEVEEQEKEGDSEDAGKSEESEGEMKPPVRQNTVEIADESEVDEEV
ncbi:hypothetical protein BJX68DRAFT_260987 [Aspergillus pseudodeflectus]|uniref:Uncharacterized protein n=1 Tax=Aspergillus pseudodeflectus TaxID=176178 RepID=A0ABR4L698_9EURO